MAPLAQVLGDRRDVLTAERSFAVALLAGGTSGAAGWQEVCAVSVEDGKLLAGVEYVDVPHDLTPPAPMPDGRPQKRFAAQLSRRAS